MIDLSKAAKLKYLTFLRRHPRSTVQWITAALQTVNSKTLQSITIRPDGGRPETIGEEFHQEWRHLDHLLVQFWTSHSIRPRVMYVAWKGKKGLRDCLPSLLPELTRRGLVDLVQGSGILEL